MREGDIVLASLQQADWQRKQRPVLLLKQMPPFQDWLVCNISSQLRQAVPDFDTVALAKIYVPCPALSLPTSFCTKTTTT